MKYFVIYMLGLLAFVTVGDAFKQRENRLAERTYTCQSGDTFWTETKWSCTAEEWRKQQHDKPAVPSPGSTQDNPKEKT